MGSDENKELVSKTWDAIVRGDVKSAFASMSDAVTWTIPGAMAGLSGVKSGKVEIIAFLRRVATTFPGGLTSDVRQIYADGDAVILEMTNRGTTATGRSYVNDYCFVFEVERGRVRAIREYVDTQKAAEVFA
ncbi:MAG: nuclear transport factor 2 family protein [Candidatus Rokubacteria bacterium]|nr:nuclear transport factor 2 family protein [Candidatus Rokubacteria bacterium]